MAKQMRSIDTLTRLSWQLNAGLILGLLLIWSALAASYWMAELWLDEKQNNAQRHFDCISGVIREQEIFLSRGARRNPAIPGVNWSALSGEGARFDDYLVQEGRGSPYAMAFSIGYPQGYPPARRDALAALGAMGADYFSAYWALAKSAAPQTFLLALNEEAALAVPAAGRLEGATALTPADFRTKAAGLRRLARQAALAGDGKLRWAAGRDAPELGDSLIVALVPAFVDARFRELEPVLAVSLLDPERDCAAEAPELRGFDTVSLIAPDGRALLGAVAPAGLRAGLNFSRQGLLFYFPPGKGQGWSALYRVDYRRLPATDLWALALPFGALLLALAGVWAARWHRQRVLAPALALAEGEAFYRTLTQRAPLALLALDAQLRPLLENALAAAWFERERDYPQLAAFWDEAAAADEAGGLSVCLRLGGRYLQARLAPARYRGVAVILCVCSDVSAERFRVMARQAARRQARRASRARSGFLGLMRAQIRAPLHGVLGALELLQQSPLNPRQRASLDTLQQASARLRQVIGLALDLYGMEAGLAQREEVEFSPLQLAEAAVRAAAEQARRKGLRLYVCVAVQAPERVRGDARSIRKILDQLLDNGIQFTESGWVILRVNAVRRGQGEVELEWQVADTGVGMDQRRQRLLFAPFSADTAGLGLPSCMQLSRLLGATLRVVSEPGLGSSFSLKLSMDVTAATEPTLHPALERAEVLLRSRQRELGENLMERLRRQGAGARWFDAAAPPAGTGVVVLDLDPVDQRPPSGGVRVLAVPGGPSPAQARLDGWLVDIHDVQAMLLAVSLARQGLPGRGEEAPPPVFPRGLKVLAAANKPLNRQLLRQQLEQLGCEVCMVDNAQQLLQHRLLSGCDLLIRDADRPAEDAHQLARALRERGARAPIVVLAARPDCGVTSGDIDAWLAKPVRLDELRAILGRLLAAAAVPPQDEAAVPAEMRALFLQIMGSDLVALRQALAAGKVRDVAALLHRMSGALAVVSATRLVRDLQALETDLAETLDLEAERARIEAAGERIAAIMRRAAGD
ncbi:ATP-binding protein [Chromobacterium aquaticum]|uniref:histidine kinase n=3 Tax=Chromobacterium aquaticum TaxID=467180 RepID=A0ABV8ZX59_9NEIS